MPVKRKSPLGEEKVHGSFRVIKVQQRYERTGRVVTLIDGEGLGETKTDLRKRQYSYYIEGTTEVEVKPGYWIINSRDDLGLVLESEKKGPWPTSKGSINRVALRVRFDETGNIRLNEIWQIYTSRPITRRMLELWQKRMTDSAKKYFKQILPGVLDSLLHESAQVIKEEHITNILQLQTLILRRAIQIGETQEVVRLTSTQLIQATKEVLGKVSSNWEQDSKSLSV